jgi:hypothetical protein
LVIPNGKLISLCRYQFRKSPTADVTETSYPNLLTFNLRCAKIWNSVPYIEMIYLIYDQAI